ncbi:hypothetical protein CNR22_11985 [Sphingobacteriaceae bacterium]|nr:hypothetical protein CNR22_11985 [Sphingobacteriaceae bacterium]
MVTAFIHSFAAEWLKKKRTAASWLTVLGAFFSPLIFLIYQLTHFTELYHLSQSPVFWESVFDHCWSFMCTMLLPLGAILAVSLVTQIEFRNTTWKLALLTPQSLSTLFFSKFAVILFMFVQFFVLFCIGTYLCGILPAVVYRGIPFPVEKFPFEILLKFSGKCFFDALPILAIQYLLGLQFKNFLVPLGLGIGLYVASMIALSWKYGYLVPYIYLPLNVLRGSSVDFEINRHFFAGLYFVFFMLLSYLLFITKKEKA